MPTTEAITAPAVVQPAAGSVEELGPLDVLPTMPTRRDLEQFGLMLLAAEGDGPAPYIHTVHHQAPGLYGRSIELKAGTFLAGLPHKVAGLATIVGDVTVWTEGGRCRYTGAHAIKTEPGSMRILYAHADTFWMTMHADPTDGSDIDAIEAALVERPELLLTRRAVPPRR